MVPRLKVSRQDPDEAAPTALLDDWLLEAQDFLRRHIERDEDSKATKRKRSPKLERLAGMHS